MSKRDLKISEESAQVQLDLFFDWYDIDFEEMYEAAKSSKGGRAVQTVKSMLIKFIRQGRIEIKEESTKDEPTLQVYQHLDRKIFKDMSIIYKEVTGRSRAAVPSSDDANDTKRMYQYLGLLSGHGAEQFDRLRGGDIGVTEVLGFLFLMV